MDASIMTATTASAIVIIMNMKTLTGHTNGSSK